MTFPTEAQAREFLAKIPMLDGVAIIQTTHEHWVITSITESNLSPKTCAICGQSFREFGCNPQPVTDGDCCAYCDDHVVTPARIALAREMGLLERPPL